MQCRWKPYKINFICWTNVVYHVTGSAFRVALEDVTIFVAVLCYPTVAALFVSVSVSKGIQGHKNVNKRCRMSAILLNK